ncbi:hypothetical protein [Aldersonia kunmingensis]|uniref:hypothetical protein n=1 Tax=Aldersonia kunmingensis TaxID=408066 RepID=UPI0012EE700B|nr:hypothetical protein [Aldersonia kunmingensis]
MNLVAISLEIADACADERAQTRIHVPNWQSMATDLEDAVSYLGSEAATAVRAETVSLIDAIRNQLLSETADDTGKTQISIDNGKRPQVTDFSAALLARLDGDDLLVAAWRDLVAGCRDSSHITYPYDRIAFLRDNAIALLEHRRQDPGHWGSIRTAVDILFDSRYSVARAQDALGEPPIAFDPRNQTEPTGLTDEERMNLAERWIVRPPSTEDTVIVWFRIANAYSVHGGDLAHGDINFYSAQVLAGVITNHAAARTALSVVPEELLTDQIREQQANIGDIDEYNGLEHQPGLVYARIVVRNIEHHAAVAEARTLLHALLSVLHPHEDMWKILNGHLVFDGRYTTRPLEWGPKTDLAPTIFAENDYVADGLRALTAEGHLIGPEKARQLQPILNLAQALDTARSDPEAIVMAAVRAIEHCNSWTTRGRKEWGEFIRLYLRDEFTRIAFLRRATEATFDAIVRKLPDSSPGAKPQPQLHDIRESVDAGSWGRLFDRQTAIGHIATLKEIYADHPLVRRLSELDDILATGNSISAAFDTEHTRVDAQVARLTRSRNAAIHGGPLSTAACDSIADFAYDLASQVLHTATWAIVTGKSIANYMRENRGENERRIRILRKTGDLRQLHAA